MASWDDLTIADLESFLMESEKQLKAEQERYKAATRTIRQQMNYASESLYKKLLMKGKPLDRYYINLKPRKGFDDLKS